MLLALLASPAVGEPGFATIPKIVSVPLSDSYALDLSNRRIAFVARREHPEFARLQSYSCKSWRLALAS